MPRRLLIFALFLFSIVGLGPSRGALADPAVATGALHPEVQKKLAEVRARRGPEVYAALRELWGMWDRADPAQVEEALRTIAESGELSPPARVYADLLSAYARRRRGDLDGSVALIRGLGFVGDWLFVGPFGNDNKTGLAEAHPPEQEQSEPIVPGRAYDGKERPVRWRALERGGGYGWFDFGDLLRPREQVCAFATTFLRAKGQSRAPRPITLWVGATGAFKVYYNGAVVLEDTSYRELDIDRLATTVTLAPGNNRVTVKACGDSTAPKFALRVGDAQGAPDLDIDVVADFAASNGPHPKPEPPRGGGVLGPVQQFERLVAGDRPPAASLEAYARYLSITAGDPAAEHRARDLARRAAESAPTVDRLLLAGLLAEDRNQTRAWVDRAKKLAGGGRDHLDILLAEAALARTGVSWRDAVPVYERMLELDPDHVAATLGLVELYVRAGLERTSLHTLERAVERQPTSVALLRVLSSQLRSVGRDTEASEVEARYAALRFDDAAFLHQMVELAVARRDAAGAERWLNRLIRSEPDATWALGVAARTYLALGQPDRALASYHKALDIAPEDVATLRALADLMGRRGERDEQLRLLRSILALHPQAKDIRAYVEHIEPPKPRTDEAYAWEPERFLPMGRTLEQRYPRRTLRNLTVTTVFDNGLASRFRQVVFQPLTDEAAASAREHAFAYHADRQAVQLRRARVYRVDGKVDEAIESGEGAANNPAIAMYTSMRTFYVRFPRLNPGDVVELRYRVDDVTLQSEMSGYFGEVEQLQSDEPIVSSEYVLITPKARTFYSSVTGIETEHTQKVEGAHRIDRWVATNVAPVAPEPAMPPWSEVLGRIHVSTFKSWDEVGKWYWGLSREQFDVDDEVRKIAREIAARNPDDASRVRAVYHYATQLRYVALEFGIEGIRPRRCALTLARGWGDCKDKATLIVTILRELGIDSTIVLLRTGMRGDSETHPASIAIFDHAIAYVPSMDLYLDGTAEGNGSLELPEMDRGSVALQINEGNPKLVRLPHPGPEASVGRRTLDATVAADGSAQIALELSASGALAPVFRRRYHSEGTRKDRLEQDLAAELGAVVLSPGKKGVDMSDLDDTESPVTMSLSGRAASFARREGDQLSLPTAAPQGLVRRYAGLSARKLDVVVGALTTREDVWTLRVPPQMKVVSVPASSRQSTPFGGFEYDVEAQGAVVRVRSKVWLEKPRIKPAEYPRFRELCEAIDRTFEQRLVIGPK